MNRKTKLLLKTLIELEKFAELDAIKVMRIMAEKYDLNYDWHVYSDLLGEMERSELVSKTRLEDGMTQYIVN